MFYRKKFLAVLALFWIAALPVQSLADDKAEVIELKEIDIITDRMDVKGTLTVPSNNEAKEIIQRTPGGVYVVPVERFERKYSLNFEDTLALIPGAFAQKRFGEEVRLSVRGSGLSRSFHLLGIRVLQDGVPFNFADGSGDFQEADTLAIQRQEVYKGGNAMGYGGYSLGGAINLVSKNAFTDPGYQLRFEAGSDETYRVHTQAGLQFDASDLFISFTGTTSDGFRNHAGQENVKLNSNVGFQLSDSVETRFYFTTNIVAQQLPGTITLPTLLSNPQAANGFAITGDQQRDFNSIRFSNKTTFDLGTGKFIDVGGYVNHKNMFHPIVPFVGIIDQESINYGGFVQARGEYDIGDHLNRFRAGVATQIGVTDALVYRNIGGHRGALTSNQDQSASTTVIYGENSFYIVPKVALVTGAQAVFATRHMDNNLVSFRSGYDDFSTFNPKVGLLYQHNENIQVFGNVSRSFEAPDFANLTQSGTVGFQPLLAQDAWTAEIGTRGRYGRVGWDVTFYRAWIDDELLQFTPGPGFPAATFNADDTIHQGMEMQLTFNLGESLLTSGDQLLWENAYNLSDFTLDGNAQWGDNNIPGQPPHFYQTFIRYQHKDGWYIAPNLKVASTAYVDFANTLESPDFAIMGLSAGYTHNENWDFFFTAVNLADTNYASTFSTITRPTAFNSAVFYPGDDRRFFGGVRARW